MAKVYLIGIPDEGLYKIGYTTRNIDKRIDEVQTGNPKKIEMIELFETKHHVKLEGWMHRLYAPKRLEGEWFELTSEDIDNFSGDCQRGHDILEVLINSGNPFI